MVPLYDWMAKKYDGYTLLGVTLLIAALTCVVSFTCAVCLGVLYKRAEKLAPQPQEMERTKRTARIKDVAYFPLTFWLLPIICVTYYVTIIPFIGLGNEFFIRKFDFSLSEANTVTSFIYILSACTSPLLGFCIDRTGRNVMWIFFAVFITLLSHILLAFTFFNPFIAMTLMGVSYSMLASALWPMIAIVIPHHQLGTAYGIMQSTLNLGLGVSSLVDGSTVDSKGYLMLEIINIICLCVSLISVVILWLVDFNRGRMLDLNATERALQSAKAQNPKISN